LTTPKNFGPNGTLTTYSVKKGAAGAKGIFSLTVYLDNSLLNTPIICFLGVLDYAQKFIKSLITGFLARRHRSKVAIFNATMFGSP
jgi:hypothetical protein